MAAEDIENPGSADGADGKPSKDVMAAAATPSQLAARARAQVACLGFVIAFLIVCMGFTSLILFGFDPPISHSTPAAWTMVAIMCLASGGCLMGLFIVQCDPEY